MRRFFQVICRYSFFFPHCCKMLQHYITMPQFIYSYDDGHLCYLQFGVILLEHSCTYILVHPHTICLLYSWRKYICNFTIKFQSVFAITCMRVFVHQDLTVRFPVWVTVFCPLLILSIATMFSEFHF